MSLKNKYISEADIFLKQLKQHKPDIINQQVINRNTWWDKDSKDYTITIEDAKNSIQESAYKYL